MDDKPSKPLDDLKAREIEILELMADGASNQEIADQLFITKETVRWYNKQIYSKLGTSRRTEAISLAREMGLIGVSTTTGPDSHQTIQYTPPVTTGPFIGRDDDLAELSDLLQSPDIRLLSIIAVGGMGKSRLSLELGHLVKGNYTHGVVFVDLMPIRNPDDIAKFVISSLEINSNDKKTPKEILLNYCHEKELLLIFDNFEHVLPGANLLSDILEHAPKVKIITSSRERLNLRVETVYSLQPVMEYGAKLFIEVAGMMRPDIVIHDEEIVGIQQIVELVGGLPLGLILAASWIDILSVADIAQEIKNNLDFLCADMGDMPERQRSIHAVIEPSWKRLSVNEQKAFMWASVFRGGFTRETFQQVTGASLRTLQVLMNRSLMSHSYGRRYDMHPLLQQYARKKLVESGSLADAKKAHLETFATYAQSHAERMYSGYYIESLDALEREADNIRAALDWSLKEHHELDTAVALILANCEFWSIRSRALEAVAYVEKALQQSDHPKLYYWQSVYLDRLGQVDRAIDAAHDLVEYGKANEDQAALAYGQIRSGMMKNSREEAVPMIQAALSNALEINDRHLVAICQSCMALLHPEVSSYHQQAQEIFEAMGDLHGISRVTNNLAICYYGDPDRQQEAKELMEYSLQLKRHIGDRAGEARRLTTMSIWAINDEELVQAQKWLVESREICEELGEQDRLSFVLSTEGSLYLIMRDFERAQATLGDALTISVGIKDYRGVVDLYSFLCQLHLLQNNLTDARHCLQKGVDSLQQDQSQPATLVLAYANYLWSIGESDTCISIVAVLSGRKLNAYIGNDAIINNFFLQPLIYRIRQHVGEVEWQQVVNKTVEVTLEQIVQSIMDKKLP